MKFRFCGDGDCPDWVLAEIHSTLSVLPTIVVKALTEIVSFEIVGKNTISDERVLEIFNGYKFNKKTAKSAMAAIKYIINNAVRYRVPSELFDNELQQLGLPKDHSSVICQVFDLFYPKILDQLLLYAATTPQLKDINLEATNSPDFKQISLGLNWHLANAIIEDGTDHCLTIRTSDLKNLIKELEIARSLMTKYVDKS